MVGLIILGVILLLLIVINATAVGVDVGYEDDEFRLSAKLNWHLIQLIPKPPDEGKKPKKEKKPKEEKPQETEKPPKEKKSKLDSLDFSKDEIMQLVKIALKAAGSFKRKLRVNYFKLWFISSDKDPYYTVQVYNYVNDALAVLGAMAENSFTVSKSDIRTAMDFDVGKDFFEVRLCMTIRIGQVVWIGLAAGIAALKIIIRHKKIKKQQLKAELAA